MYSIPGREWSNMTSPSIYARFFCCILCKETRELEKCAAKGLVVVSLRACVWKILHWGGCMSLLAWQSDVRIYSKYDMPYSAISQFTVTIAVVACDLACTFILQNGQCVLHYACALGHLPILNQLLSLSTCELFQKDQVSIGVKFRSWLFLWITLVVILKMTTLPLFTKSDLVVKWHKLYTLTCVR